MTDIAIRPGVAVPRHSWLVGLASLAVLVALLLSTVNWSAVRTDSRRCEPGDFSSGFSPADFDVHRCE
jgi:hypothetical protein